MRSSYLEYNPVFESLSQQAKKYTNIHINEDVIKYEGEKSQKYLKLIIDKICSRIVTFTTSVPEKDLRDSLLRILAEGYKELSTGTSTNLDALINSLKELFDEAYAEIASSTSRDKLVPIYDKVKDGMELLLDAYENLKKKYPSETSNPVSLENAKKYLTASMESFNSTLEELKKKI